MRTSKIIHNLIALIFWLAVWEIAARALNLGFAFPTIQATLQALGKLAGTVAFWGTIAQSLGRILWGLVLGTALGSMLALLSVSSKLADAILRPAMTVIRCTPVASFIMVLWILVGRDPLPTTIAVLMVMPVIWQSLRDGYATLDTTLDEVVSSFHASPLQRLTMFVLPSLRQTFLTALVTSAGLAWKAGVAAEIIAYTANSIGRSIADARNLFDGPAMMAWTVCVVVLSLLMEKGMQALLYSQKTK